MDMVNLFWRETMRMIKRVLLMIVFLMLLTGCGKNDTTTWMNTTESLQEWYQTISADAVERNSLLEYVDVFLDCHEKELDYGLAYGITAMLCEELELYEVPVDISDEELAIYFSDAEHLYLLDFTLPTFETHYFDEETVKYVQAAAISFAKLAAEEVGLENTYQLCVGEDNEAVTVLKNNWLQSIGVKETYEPYAELEFTRNSRRETGEYPYVLSDAEANWYFHPADVKEYGYKEFMDEYLIVKELMELDFADAKELFETRLPENVPAVDIHTEFYKDDSTEGGIYFPARNYIVLYYDWETAKYALLHEYVHYLTLGVTNINNTVGAFAEGIAEEVAVWGCENRLYALTLSSMYGGEQVEGTAFWDAEKERVTANRMTYITAQNFYAGIFDGTPYKTVSQNIVERSGKIEHIGFLSYQEMASLTHYLIELYGRDTVYESYYNLESFEKFIGKDFVELYDEWAEWNLEQCHELGAHFIYE